MSNPIKYTTGSESLALKKGNFYIGTGDVGKGPSDVTGYYQGVSPSGGGYVIYMNKPESPGNLSYHNATNDSELITFTNNLAGTSYTTVQECLVYYASQTDKVVLNRDYPPIVTNGLVLTVDAGFTPSYPTSGTTWYNLNGTNNGTLTNGPTFNSNGVIVFDGADDYVGLGNIVQNSNSSTTIEVVMKNNSNIVNPSQQQINFILNGSTTGNVDAYDQYTLSVSTSIPFIVLKSRMLYSSALSKYSYQVYYQILSNDMNNYPIVVQKYYNSDGSLFSEAINYPQIINLTYSYVWSITNSDSGTRSIKHYLNGQQITPLGGAQTADFNFFNQPNLRLGFKSNSNISISRIYNRALSVQEVLQNYLGGSIVTNGLVFALDAGNLVSYESGSTTTYSLTGTSTGTLVNGVGYNGGNSGTWVFDGVDDYTSFTAPGLGGTATVEMWCKIGSGYSNKMFCGWLNYDVYCAGGRIGYNTGNSDVYGISQATVSSLGIIGQWAHYVFEFRSDVSYTNNKIYINGVLQTLSQQLSTENPATRNFNNGNGRIAIWGGGGSYNMPMSCAIFRVYNRSLSQQEVLQNYATQKPRF